MDSVLSELLKATKYLQLAGLVSKSTLYFIQYLRSLLDMGGIYDNEKAGKWKVIKDMTVIGAMRNPTQGTNDENLFKF